MSGYPGGHAGLILVAVSTHALVGAALGSVAVGRPWAGLVGGVLADVDLLVPQSLGFPFAHRGLTHAPAVALLAVIAVALLADDRRIPIAFGVGYASQLLIDLATANGLPVAYPFSETMYSLDLGAHSGAATLVLWIASLALLGVSRRSGPVAGDVDAQS